MTDHATWKYKHPDGSDVELAGPDEVRAAAREGRIRAETYVYNPVLAKWTYASDVRELQEYFPTEPSVQKVVVETTTKESGPSGCGCLTGTAVAILGGLGLMFLIIIPPLGFLLIIAAILLAVIRVASK